MSAVVEADQVAVEINYSAGGDVDLTPKPQKQGRQWLSDQLYQPWYIIVNNPKITFYVWFSTNSVFVTVCYINSFIISSVTIYGFLALMLAGLYAAIVTLTRALVYPGWISSILRKIEHDIGNEVKRLFITSLDYLDETLKVISDSRRIERNDLISRCQNIEHLFAQYVDSVRNTLSMLKEKRNGTIGFGGDEFLEELIALDNSFQHFMKIFKTVNDVNTSIYTISDQLRIHCNNKKSEIENHIYPLKYALSQSKQHSNCLVITNEENDSKQQEKIDIITYLKRALTDCNESRKPIRCVAGVEYMRHDLQTRLGGQQYFLNTKDGTVLDTMFIPAKSPREDNRTILLCNPNSGVYEFAAFSCFWIKFYTERNINVFMYNYRGYSRSGGRPHPISLCQDGECIVDYLVNVKNVRKLGIHGESIGGIVAVYLASKSKHVELLIADRTFSSLSTVASYIIAGWAKKVLNSYIFNDWSSDNVVNYLTACSNVDQKVYCVVTCDVDDNIIDNRASLKLGVARYLYQQSMDLQSGVANLPSAQTFNSNRIFTATVMDILEGSKLTSFRTSCLFIFNLVQSSEQALVSQRLFINYSQLLLVLWNTDGNCGMRLGDALGRDGDLLDFLLCYLVFGTGVLPKSPPKLKPGAFTQWELGDETGIIAQHMCVDLQQSAKAVSSFVEGFKMEIQENPIVFQHVLNVTTYLNQLSAAFDTVRQAATERPFNLNLLPLHCGHNGWMLENERNVLLQHLHRANWISRPI